MAHIFNMVLAVKMEHMLLMCVCGKITKVASEDLENGFRIFGVSLGDYHIGELGL